MKRLLLILLALPLLSVAPVPAPAPAVYWTRLTIQTGAPLRQPCTFETANARLQQQIEDPIGYPYGMVRAFSCSGDAAGVIAELQTRAAAMQAAAAVYRQAHPIGGAK
jgi:hypothetical protein